MTLLSVLIPGRNEEFMARTIADVLQQSRGETEVIAVLDGYWPDPVVPDHPRLTVIHHTEAIGQRGAVNEAAKLARGQFLMKLDAHCTVAEGFDVTLAQPYQTGELGADVTTIPRMYNLHAYNLRCTHCGQEVYQRPEPEECGHCHQRYGFTRVMVWQPRWGRRTDFARFDANVQFQYWRRYEKRPEVRSQGDLADVMCAVGACWFMPADRFWHLGGMDGGHGGWGQFGVEIACKSWLSGGRQVVNKRTWFAHMFRSQWRWQNLWPITQEQIDHARAYSRDLWTGNKWPGQTREFRWLVDKFKPVPGWHEPEPPKKDREVHSDGDCPV